MKIIKKKQQNYRAVRIIKINKYELKIQFQNPHRQSACIAAINPDLSKLNKWCKKKYKWCKKNINGAKANISCAKKNKQNVQDN